MPSDGSVISVEIHGQRYPIRSTLDQDYVTRLASYVDEKMRAAADQTPTGDSLRLAVLTALNVADNGLRAKTAERAVINEQLNQGQVLAPADGRVLKRLITVGSVVLAGDPIVTVAQQNFKLRLRVPERHARLLKAGDRIRIDGAELDDFSRPDDAARRLQEE